jgi:hypothetical protein
VDHARDGGTGHEREVRLSVTRSGVNGDNPRRNQIGRRGDEVVTATWNAVERERAALVRRALFRMLSADELDPCSRWRGSTVRSEDVSSDTRGSRLVENEITDRRLAVALRSTERSRARSSSGK